MGPTAWRAAGVKTLISPIGRGPHSHSGFTLLEILLALLILTVFMMVSLTRIEAILPQGALRLATRMIIGEIAWTRGKAASTHRDLVLEFNEGDNTLTCCGVEDEGNAPDSNAGVGWGERRRKVKLPDGVALSDIIVSSRTKNQDGTIRVQFYANGTVDPLVIYIGNDQNETFRMEVNPLTGEVRLYDHHDDQRSQR
jgi:prepilin-type N-terminal cleavage/methylation domain-containing protein